MEMGGVILAVGMLVFLAHLFSALFERTRIPDVFFLILIGLCVGPVFHIVQPRDFGNVGRVFTTVALVVILFEAGLELKLENLRNALRGVLTLTIGSFVLTWVMVTAATYAWSGLSWPLSLFVGALLAGPAPAVVIPLSQQLGLRNNAKTMLTLESALGEALCIIVALCILQSMQLQSVHAGQMIGQIVSSFILALLLGSTSGYLWSLMLKRTRQIRNAIFTTPSFVFVVYGVTELLGFSGLLAVLAFSVTIENVDIIKLSWLSERLQLAPIHLNRIEKLFFSEIVFLLKTFFFVFLGLSVQLTDPKALGLALGLSAVLVIARLMAVRTCVPPNSACASETSVMAAMVPKGLAAAALAAAPVQLGLAGSRAAQDTIFSVVICSIVLTTLLVFLIQRTAVGRLYGRVFARYGSNDSEPSVSAAKGGHTV